MSGSWRFLLKSYELNSDLYADSQSSGGDLRRSVAEVVDLDARNAAPPRKHSDRPLNLTLIALQTRQSPVKVPPC